MLPDTDVLEHGVTFYRKLEQGSLEIEFVAVNSKPAPALCVPMQVKQASSWVRVKYVRGRLMLRPMWHKLINCLSHILSVKTLKSNLLPVELLQISHTYFIRFWPNTFVPSHWFCW